MSQVLTCASFPPHDDDVLLMIRTLMWQCNVAYDLQLRTGHPVPRELSTDTVLCTNGCSNKTKTKKKQSGEQKKKNWKNLVFNLNRAKLSRYHRASKREREQSHASAPVTASRPALSRERKRNSTAHSVYLHTPFPYNSTHTPTLRMFQYQPVNQSLSNLTAWSNQYNSIRPHCLHCLQRFLEKTWVKDVCFPSMSDFLALWVNTLADDQAESGALHRGKTRKFTVWLPKPETENYSWHTPHLNIRFVLPENVIWQSLQETLLLGISCISKSNISTSSSREPDLMRNL